MPRGGEARPGRAAGAAKPRQNCTEHVLRKRCCRVLTLRDVKWAGPRRRRSPSGDRLGDTGPQARRGHRPQRRGKTTLAKMIVGLEKPDSGSIELDGQDITNLDITQRARLGISFAFQQPVRFKGLTVMGPAGAGRRRQDPEGGGLRVPEPRRALRARIHRPRGQRHPLRRRDQAHRDRNAPLPAAAS